MEWRAMMTETPYAQWVLGAKASLDYWLMTKVLCVKREDSILTPIYVVYVYYTIYLTE